MDRSIVCYARRCLLVALVVAGPWAARADAQVVARSVGGVLIDAEGVISSVEATADGNRELLALREQARDASNADLQQANDLRKISLRRLSDALQRHIEAGTPLEDEMLFLAGLQRIEYVFVYPEQNDIVLAGFGEGWEIDETGAARGVSTGMPPMLLDDLLTALRGARQAASGGITCSIDPTPEGLQRLQSYVSSIENITDPQATAKAIEEALGLQQITVGGVPDNSHFAMVLVAADYKMKRIGMNLDPSPVPGLTSYLQMIRGGGRGMSALAPRWWMVPDYAPLRTDGQGLAWQLPRQGVKTMTEDTVFAADGQKKQTGTSSALAQRWADMMTSRYQELAQKEPVFAELGNAINLAVVAALIVKEDLGGMAQLNAPMLLDPARLPTPEFNPPRHAPSQVSMIRQGNNLVLSASGGVEIDSWGIASKQETTGELSPVREGAYSQAESWWWN